MNNNLLPVRVRIAPSPTGFFHLGNARTALYNWLYAKKMGGAFILRIEDTDRERSRPEFEKDILESLAWLGIEYDEFYRQSERGEIYKKYLQLLLNDNKAFYCNHTVEELENESESQRNAKEPPRHICSHRDQKLTKGIIRLRNDSTETIVIKDIVRGDVTYEAALFGDFSLAKALEEVLYNFAVVVDDHEMNISHVIRGEDHISNTPKQILIGHALGFTDPSWAHLPLLLGQDKSKLSKRHGGTSLKEYRDAGYLAEAMVNFMALLGWHPSAEGKRGEKEKEIITGKELVEMFSLEKIQKGGAIVSLEKLNWFNKEYLKNLPLEEITKQSKIFIQENTMNEISPETLRHFINVIRSRITTLSEIQSEIELILNPPQYTKELLLWHGKINSVELKEIIDNIYTIFSNISTEDFKVKSIEQALNPLIEKNGKGKVLWPLRAALSGRETSPGPYELAEILGKNTCITRLHIAKNLP